MTYITDLLDSKSPAALAALRTTANSCLMRAISQALRLARIELRNVGNGIDGANNLRANADAAKARAKQLEGAGKQGITAEEIILRNFRMYYAIAVRLEDRDNEYERAMTVDQAFELATTPRDSSKLSQSAELAALSKISGMSPEDILKMRDLDARRFADSAKDAVPLARTMLDDVAHNGVGEDELFLELPVQQQFQTFAKATEAAVIQLQRDTQRAARFLESPVRALRDLAFSDVTVSKADADSLEKQLEHFIVTHKSELEFV